MVAVEFSKMKSIALAIVMALPVSAVPNQLTPQEKKDNFQLLFDGKSLEGWRTFKLEKPNPQWQVENGNLTLASGGGGDLISEKKYRDFDLRWEWKISEQGNSGVMWRVSESFDYPYDSGPEFQILDSFRKEGHRYTAELNRGNIAGALYDLVPGKPEWSRPVGEWNESRIVVKGSRITFYLNGTCTVDVDSGTPAWTTMLSRSKFKDWPHYNREKTGHICLQDHGDSVSFRTIRIKSL